MIDTQITYKIDSFFVTHSIRMADKEEKIKEAIKEIEENGMSKKKASKIFGIARSTLQFRMGRTFKKTGYGPVPYLSHDEENVLVKYVQDISQLIIISKLWILFILLVGLLRVSVEVSPSALKMCKQVYKIL